MTENQEDTPTHFGLSIGFYPGILLGVRTYEELDRKVHVLYLPFIDFALEISK